MASEQRLPYLPKADVVVLADGSRWVRERTCHVVKLHGCNEYDNCYSCSVCNYGWHMSRYDRPYRFCPNCGARSVDEKEE